MDATKRRDIPTPRALREMADRLNALAVAMEGPRPAPGPRHDLTCRDCGATYSTPYYRSGDPCLTTVGREVCQGTLTMAARRTESGSIRLTEEQVDEAAMHAAWRDAAGMVS